MMRNTSVLVLLWVTVWTSSSYGRSVQSGSPADMARQEYLNHHYDQSEKLFRSALDSRNMDDLTRAAILRDLGTVYAEEERLPEAEQAYIKALQIFRRSAQSNDTALLLRHLGSVYSIQRRHDDAKRVLNEAMNLGLRLEILNSLGVACFRDGNIRKAEKLFTQGLELSANAQGAFDAQRMSLLNNLGSVYLKKRDFRRAERLITESLNLTEVRFGSSHPELVPTLNTLGVLYTDMRRYADAEQQYKRAIAILEKDGPEFDVRLARAFKGLSDTYIKANRMAEAEMTLQRAIPIARSRSTEHPDMAGVLEAYSILLRGLGKPQEAQKLYAEAHRARLAMGLTVRAYTPD
jgi:tetratricopeptide (TPR) repeat protein